MGIADPSPHHGSGPSSSTGSREPVPTARRTWACCGHVAGRHFLSARRGHVSASPPAEHGTVPCSNSVSDSDVMPRPLQIYIPIGMCAFSPGSASVGTSASLMNISQEGGSRSSQLRYQIVGKETFGKETFAKQTFAKETFAGGATSPGRNENKGGTATRGTGSSALRRPTTISPRGPLRQLRWEGRLRREGDLRQGQPGRARRLDRGRPQGPEPRGARLRQRADRVQLPGHRRVTVSPPTAPS